MSSTESVEDPELGLRPMIEDDLPAKVRWANDPRVNEWIGMAERVNLEGTRKWFAGQQANPRILLFTITHAGEAIGFAKLERSEDGREGHYCGLAIGEPQYWGRGLGKATVRALLKVAFEEEGWERFWGYWPAWNERSIGLHQGLGFEIVGTAADKRTHLDGSEHEVYVLAITPAQWAAAR